MRCQLGNFNSDYAQSSQKRWLNSALQMATGAYDCVSSCRCLCCVRHSLWCICTSGNRQPLTLTKHWSPNLFKCWIIFACIWYVAMFIHFLTLLLVQYQYKNWSLLVHFWLIHQLLVSWCSENAWTEAYHVRLWWVNMWRDEGKTKCYAWDPLPDQVLLRAIEGRKTLCGT